MSGDAEAKAPGFHGAVPLPFRAEMCFGLRMSLILRRTLSPLLLRAACAFALVLAMQACTAANRTVPGGTYVVIAPRTPFYRFGPMQNTGPDAMLELGERVTLVSKEYGYSRFKTAQGVTGYAATNDFQLAPTTTSKMPGRLINPTPVPKNSGRRRAPAAPERKLDLGDVPVPDLPSGGQEAKPGFRVR
jgi:hypothetical protein